MIMFSKNLQREKRRTEETKRDKKTRRACYTWKDEMRQEVNKLKRNKYGRETRNETRRDWLNKRWDKEEEKRRH